MSDNTIKRPVGRPRKNPLPVETKAVNSWSGTTTSIQNIIPTSVSLQSDPVSLMSYNKGYVFACVNKISDVLSALSFKLYAYQRVNGQKYLNSQIISQMDMKRIKQESKALPLQRKLELVEIYEHPFIDLINQPYSDYTISEFFNLITQYLLLIGNCYILKIFDKSNQIVGLQVLDSEYMTIGYDDIGQINRYIYMPNGSRKNFEFPVETIVHIKNRTAGSVIAGRGELESCIDSFAVSYEAQKYTRTLLQNYCMPGSAIIIKNGESLSDEAKNTIARNFTQRFGGDSRGRSVVLDTDIEIRDMSSTLQDNLTDKFVELSKKEIAAVFGVPLDLIDSSGSNRATSLVAMESLLKFCVYPKCFNILDQINRQIVHPYFSEDLLFWVDTSASLETSPQEQADLYKKYLEMGVLTSEEIRQKLGFSDK